jgi:hypothetical protein
MTNEVRPTPEQLGESILRGVRDFVSRVAKPMDAAIKALGERIDALPKPERGEVGPEGPRGADGNHGVDGAPGNDGAPGAEGKAGPAGPQGDRGPAGADGKDGAVGAKGADCDMAAVERMIEGAVQQRVAAAVAALPKPADGKDGAAGKDAFAIAKDLGFEGTIADWLISIRGKDGTHGLDGRDALPGEPGRDGISCDEIVAYEEGKHFGIRFMKGGKVLSETKWLKPTLADLDEGTWQPKSYERGAHVTWAGCTWFAKADTAEEPGRGEAWRLMAKKGRDGRDRTERKQNVDGDVYRIAPK